jgi:sec-independent protein translocase protein TatA
MGIENPVHLLFLGGVALLVLGPKRLPEVARSLGRGIREFREAMSEGSDPRAGAGAGAGTGEARPTSGARPDAPPPPQATPVDAHASQDDAHAAQVDPPGSVGSGDAPDSRPL